MDQKEAYLYYPADKNLTYHEILTQKLNYWRSQLLDRTANYHESVSRLIANPTAMLITTSGERSISSVVDQRLQAVRESKSLVLIGEKMLAELGTSQEAVFELFLKEEVLKESTQWLSINKADLEPTEPAQPEVDPEAPKPEEEKGTGAEPEDDNK